MTARVRRDGVWRSLPRVPAPLRQVRILRAARGGNIWAVGSHGMYLLRREPQRWQRVRHTYPDVHRNRIHEIVIGADGGFTVATAAGVDAYDADRNGRPLGPFPDGPLPNVTALVRDERGDLWAGSGSGFTGLRRWDGRSWVRHDRDADGEPIGFVHKARRDRSGRVWFLGLARDEAAPQLHTGNVWVLGDDGPKRWAPAVELGERRFYDVAEGRGGLLWFATGAGVMRWDGDHWRAPIATAGETEYRPFRVAPDDVGGAWVASTGDGLAYIDRDGRAELVEVAGDRLGGGTWDVLIDGERVWVATNDGIACLLDGEWSTLGLDAGLGELKIWPLALDGERLFVGTRGGGLYILDLAETATPPPQVAINQFDSDVGRVHTHWQVFPWWGHRPPAAIETRHRVDDGAWSRWSTSRDAALTGLAPREHRVEVQSRSLFGRLGAPEVMVAALHLPLHRSPAFFVPLLVLTTALAAMAATSYVRNRRDAARLLAVEGEVAHSRRALAAILDGLPDAFVAFDRDRKFTYLNASALRMARRVGLDAIAMLGRDVREVFPSVREQEPLIDRVIREQAVIEVEHHFKPLGLWFAVRGYPSADGAYVHAQDITERRRQEELERKLLDAQRLESLGVLAGGVAHDFNNLLTAIIGNAEVALGGLPADGAAAESLREVTKAARRAADLTEQLLAYAGRGTFVREPVELGRLVSEMAELLRVSLGQGVVLELDLAEGLAPVDADASSLRQVVMNLIVNASEAIGSDAGTILVCTRPAGDDPAHVHLEVSDDGPGMEAETRERLFDPFLTTKFAGRGLGLAAVLGIVESHSGRIDVVSAPGKGARFVVVLPVASA